METRRLGQFAGGFAEAVCWRRSWRRQPRVTRQRQEWSAMAFISEKIATFRVAKLTFQGRKSNFGGCRDRPSRALPFDLPECTELSQKKQKEKETREKNAEK